MIVCNIELHSARTGKVTPLAHITIANDGTSRDPRIGHYDARFFGKRGPLRAVGRVIGWRRKSKTVFELLAAALRNAGYVALLVLAFTTSAHAQHVDLGLDVGKAYSIVDGAWVPSVIPSVSLLFGPITVSTSTYLHGRTFFEQDTTASWYQREDAMRRWSLYGSVGHYKYPKGYDWTGSVGMRWRLR